MKKLLRKFQSNICKFISPLTGERLISLDCNYTKEYNYNQDEFMAIILVPFIKGIDFATGVESLWQLPQRIISQMLKTFLLSFLRPF